MVVFAVVSCHLASFRCAHVSTYVPSVCLVLRGFLSVLLQHEVGLHTPMPEACPNACNIRLLQRMPNQMVQLAALV